MKIYQVDAFTNKIFKGNPAGVCILPPGKIEDDRLLQNIAAEMNLSETAFLTKQNGEYRLRWFTPTTEVTLCGHATLASAHILRETGAENKQDVITFNTLSGKLYARSKEDRIELDFPTFEIAEISPQKNINKALGIEPVFSGMGNEHYLFEVENLKALQEIRPDFGKLKDIGKKAFIVTCKSDSPRYDFYSRFFAPSVGIDEDPVTGSAHSYLTPYWSKKLGKNRLKAFQASKRGGELECELGGNGRVYIRGQARMVFEITMRED
jgi:PhzF family phenazine biosynthesis protein